MKRFADIEVLEEDVEGPAAKLPLIETWDVAYPTKVYPEPYQMASKSITFEVKARKGNWFLPSDVQLHIKVRPRLANGNRPFNPANAAHGANTHVRFINDVASWIIKSVRVKPKRQHDVEVISPYLAFEEALRSDLQTSKDEKESEQLLFYRCYEPKMNYNPHQTKCGIAKAAPNADELVVKNFEIYQYNLEWIPLVIKPLPGFFHEIHKALPSLMDFVVELDLQDDAMMVISRQGANDGDGAAQDAIYQIHPQDIFLLIDYKSMGEDEDEKMEKKVFAQDDLLFDTYDKVRLSVSKTITENNAAEGILIKDWTSLDGRIPERFFFGLVNAAQVTQTTNVQVPGLFKPFQCSKIQLYIDDRPIFKKGHIDWTNNLSNRRYIWSTQCDMVADIGDSKRVNIGNFPLEGINNGRWFAYVDLSANRKKGVANTVRKIDGIFTARVWFSATNNANRRQLVIGWFERGEIVCVNPLDNSWAPKTFKELPTKSPIKFSNIRDGSSI